MTALASTQSDAECSVIDLEAENEHFAICDSLISCIELIKYEDEYEGDENDVDQDDLPSRQSNHVAVPTASALAWCLIKRFSDRHQQTVDLKWLAHKFNLPNNLESLGQKIVNKLDCDRAEEVNIRMRGNFEWAPPRPQIIFNIHSTPNLKKLMIRQNYRCAGCGINIDQEMARRLVLYCNYLGKYFCKCCHSHKAMHLPGYILHKWDFRKYPVSHFALQLLDKIANDPLFNINDTNPSLYQKSKKLRRLFDVRMQLYYLQIYVSTCKKSTVLNNEFTTFAHQHLLQDEVHLYSLNNLIEIQHGKLFEYLNDLVSRSIAHVAQCDICRAKGHYCQLCGPRSLMSSSSRALNGDPQIGSGETITNNNQQGKTIIDHTRTASGNYSQLSSGSWVHGTSPTTSNCANLINIDDPELIFPFEIGRVAQCRICGCCFHLQCFLDAGENCPKCERIQRRKVEKSQDG